MCERIGVPAALFPRRAVGTRIFGSIGQKLYEAAAVRGFRSPYWLTKKESEKWGITLRPDAEPIQTASSVVKWFNGDQTTDPAALNPHFAVERNICLRLNGTVLSSSIETARAIRGYKSVYWAVPQEFERWNYQIPMDQLGLGYAEDRVILFNADLAVNKSSDELDIFNGDLMAYFVPKFLFGNASFATAEETVELLRTSVEHNYISTTWIAIQVEYENEISFKANYIEHPQCLVNGMLYMNSDAFEHSEVLEALESRAVSKLVNGQLRGMSAVMLAKHALAQGFDSPAWIEEAAMERSGVFPLAGERPFGELRLYNAQQTTNPTFVQKRWFQLV